MSSSAINQSVFQAKIGSVQNDADSSAVYSAGVWSFKNSTALTSVTITNSGNVGIGTDSPAVLSFKTLNIAGGASGALFRLSSTAVQCSLVANQTLGSFNIATETSHPIQFYTNGSERGRIDASGQLIVGNSSINSTTRHIIYGYGGASEVASLTVRSTEASDGDRPALALQKALNSTATTQRFVTFLINASVSASGSGQINANGAGAAAFGSYSDRRLKENIVPLAGELQKVLALNPVEFDYKDGSGHQFGFIAQEIEEVYPDAVSVLGETEEMKTVTGWDKTTARLVKAIQELSAKNDALEARLAALEAK